MRILLVILSLVSFLVSVLYLFLFTIPHASWMPAVPDWQEVAPKILSQLHKETDWQPDDGNLLLLVSITNLVGSIGYDKSSFYKMVSPYWSNVLTTTSIFSMAMALSSCVLLWYLIYNYKLNLRYTPIPWLILHAILWLLVLVGMFFLLEDMNSTSRLELEYMMGMGNYAMVITGMMVILVYLQFCMMAAWIHMDEKMFEREKQDRLDRLYSRTNISWSSSIPL